ncbi:MAG: flavodoxin family protein [Promethearchaeota archaeon]|jgi:multimeric flavodoxin WrbA
MQVLGIVGSPRIGGNTDTLVDEVLAGAAEAGASTEKIILNKLEIKPCQACNSCYKTGKCAQKDDMAELLDKMVESDLWILGTPVYWWGPTAQFKAFLDRWYHPKHQEFKGKRVIMVVPLGGGSETYARHTTGLLEDVFSYLNIELVEKVLAPGFNRRGDVKNDVNLIEKARKAGNEAVKDIN